MPATASTCSPSFIHPNLAPKPDPGLRDESFTARTSAANLLAIVATSRGPGRSAAGGQSEPEAMGKRKKAAAARKQSKADKCAGADVLQVCISACRLTEAIAWRHGDQGRVFTWAQGRGGSSGSVLQYLQAIDHHFRIVRLRSSAGSQQFDEPGTFRPARQVGLKATWTCCFLNVS